jgi:hypothetical protein
VPPRSNLALLGPVARGIMTWRLTFIPRLVIPLPLFSRTARIRTEQWIKGREEYRRLQRADVVVVSYGKSGRTWLRAMLSRYYQQQYCLPDDVLLKFDNLHRLHHAIPRILFTHDAHIKDYTGNSDAKRDFYSKRVILLLRDPRDVAVSNYFHWKYRSGRAKNVINADRRNNIDMTILRYVKNIMPKIIRFMNSWQRESRHVASLLTVRYEDLRDDTDANLRRVLDFLRYHPSDVEIRDAVSHTTFAKMRERERRGQYKSDILMPADPANPDSYKVRRAKVGGYRDYFTPIEIEDINRYMRLHLDPSCGYRAV